MNLIDITLLAIALGIDCMIVSFSQGLIFDKNRTKTSLKLAVVMGLFQGLMPVIGYVGTHSLYKFIVPYGKWIVFGIFFILGLKFILETFQPQKTAVRCIGIKCLIGFGIATSIDALVSGVTLRLTETNLIEAMAIIGLVSFCMSLAGFWSGNYIKNSPSKYLEVSGGIILIILAIKSII